MRMAYAGLLLVRRSCRPLVVMRVPRDFSCPTAWQPSLGAPAPCPDMSNDHPVHHVQRANQGRCCNAHPRTSNLSDADGLVRLRRAMLATLLNSSTLLAAWMSWSRMHRRSLRPSGPSATVPSHMSPVEVSQQRRKCAFWSCFGRCSRHAQPCLLRANHVLSMDGLRRSGKKQFSWQYLLDNGR